MARGGRRGRDLRVTRPERVSVWETSNCFLVSVRVRHFGLRSAGAGVDVEYPSWKTRLRGEAEAFITCHHPISSVFCVSVVSLIHPQHIRIVRHAMLDRVHSRNTPKPSLTRVCCLTLGLDQRAWPYSLFECTVLDDTSDQVEPGSVWGQRGVVWKGK